MPAIQSMQPTVQVNSWCSSPSNNGNRYNPCFASSTTGRPPGFNNRTRSPDRSFTSRNLRPNRRKESEHRSSLQLDRKNPKSLWKEIHRLAGEDRLDDALAMMNYMNNFGVPVNATAFSSLIACCIRHKSLPSAREIHVHLRVNGLESNEFLRKKMVLLYTSCGSFEDARKLFEESPCRDVYSWNALIRGSVIAGGKRYKDVLSTYTEMRLLGVELNFYTFINVLKSFAGASALHLGFKTHGLLIKNGFLGNAMIQTCLIDMYFKCGKIKLAHQLFGEMLEKDIVLWGVMIAGFVHNRRQWEALDYVRWMVSEGMYPNSVILTTILPAIGELMATKVGREVHAYILKTKDYARHLTVQSGLIDMYCKCKEMASGRLVFYQSSERNAISWTALMSGYVSNGLLVQALRSVVWMQQEGCKPDTVTVATVIPVCKELKALKQGQELHAYSIRRCFFPNVSISTSLMKLYSECSCLEYSVRLFDGLVNKNLISWTALIDVYMKSGHINEALQVFRSLVLSKHMPDSVVSARILNICGQIKALKLGKEMHAQALKRGFEYIPFVSADIIKMYGSCLMIHSAKCAFNAISIKGSISWSAIIEANANSNQMRDAMALFNEMISCGSTPTRYTFDIVLAICKQAGFTNEAVNIIKLMSQRSDIIVSKDHYSTVIELLTASGRAAEARSLTKLSNVLS